MSKRVKLLQAYSQLEYGGVYVLLNKRLNIFYVGESKNLHNRLQNHMTGKSKESIYQELIMQDDTKLHIGSIEKGEMNDEEYESNLRLYEYALYIFMNNEGYKSLNYDNAFRKNVKKAFDDGNIDINIEKYVDFKIDLFSNDLKDWILNRDIHNKLKHEKSKLSEENDKLKKELSQSKVIKSKESISKALQLYINRIINDDNIIQLIVYSRCNIDDIINIIFEGKVNFRLIDGINHLTSTDISMLLGESVIGEYDEEQLRKFRSYKDNNNIVKRLYEPIEDKHMLQRVVDKCGIESINLIKRAIDSGVITLELRKIFETIYDSSWGVLIQSNEKQLPLILNNADKQDVRKKTITFIDMLYANGLLEQKTDVMYDYKGDRVNEKKFNENSKLIHLLGLKLKAIYKYNEYRDMFRVVAIGDKYISNYMVINEIDNYRFNELHYSYDDNGYNGTGYFIFDYNDDIKTEDNNYAKYIYEVDLETFYYFISKISSYRGDMELDYLKEEAETNLAKLSNTIADFIKFSNEITKLKRVLSSKLIKKGGWN